ncbi:uncharacterized protein LOC106168417 [Lingula anatina]|uniref:Uncharacterized protein LOC106168417 n=1 Tax=Lingula anatina TaxID=7574 RepID=A0A1S3IXH8_LINAN|nr:uncharacterized protein LOC106168417 [Lingula anatina]|eukprot:XP_013402905.1 uncharacterized protein LOC106168417 [Lingula anatina]
MTIFYFLVLFYMSVCPSEGNTLAELVYSWVTIDYDWPSNTTRAAALASEEFIPEHNSISGIKFYKGEIYITIPRWKLGVPSSLNKLVTMDGRSVFQPYPSWAQNEIYNCSALQYVQQMEIDPVTGWMWIIDTGRINTIPPPGTQVQNMCPAKLWIYDMNRDILVRQYEFPENIVSRTNNFLNDIVVDKSGFAYITDSGNDRKGGIIIYNYNTNTTHRINHASMWAVDNASAITINGQVTTLKIPTNGIALSPDFTTLYYCPLSGYNLYSISTEEARDPLKASTVNVQTVGRKVSQTDGMAMGKNSLYYGALSLNAVYKWERSKDVLVQGNPENVTLATQVKVASDNQRMQWVNAMVLTDDGYLWFVAAASHKFLTNKMDFSGVNGTNFHVWRIQVNDTSILSPVTLTSTLTPEVPSTTPVTSVAGSIHTSIWFFINLCLSWYIHGLARYVLLKMTLFYFLVLFYLSVCPSKGNTLAELVYSWVTIDYDWPSNTTRAAALASEEFIPEHNSISGIKFYKGEIYITIPRWKLGVPSSLNKLVTRGGRSVFQPYPSWAQNEIYNCSALQYVQQVEIDPCTQVQNMCPAKLWIYDMNRDILVRQYEFPENIVSRTNNFLNDIVVDKSGFAYITDSGNDRKGGIIVYNYNTNTTHRINHESMWAVDNASAITINGQVTTVKIPTNGIALSPDFTTLYYCPLSGYNLYSISTEEAQDPLKASTVNVQTVGRKVSQTDGMAMGKKSLYYGALSLNAVYKWERSKDVLEQGNPKKVTLATQVKVASDNQRMQWVNAMALTDDGYLWFITAASHKFLLHKMDFSGVNGTNFHVWRIQVNDTSILSHVALTPEVPSTTPVTSGAGSMQASTWFYIKQCLSCTNLDIDVKELYYTPKMTIFYFLVLFYMSVCPSEGNTLAELVYSWVTIDYDWPSNTTRAAALASEEFIPEHNSISGIKFYKGEIYITIPRWKLGVPSSLNKLVTRGGRSVFQPYPSWAQNEIYNCSALQYVQQMEIDPVTGWMWIIDTGRINTIPPPVFLSLLMSNLFYIFSLSLGTQVQNMCPAKLWIYDMNRDILVRQYEFPENIVSRTNNFLNDIVVDKSGFAYITDSGNERKGGIIVYNYNTNTTHRINHESMWAVDNASAITINGQVTTLKIPSNGIALSPDFTTLYYCPLSGYNLYSISTEEAQDPLKASTVNVQTVGRKVSQTDGMAMGKNSLYYGALSLNAVYKWERSKDVLLQGNTENVTLATQVKVASDNQRMQWVNAMALTDDGYLWFITAASHKFLLHKMDFSGVNGTNFHVWRIQVNDTSILSPVTLTSTLTPEVPSTTPVTSVAGSIHTSIWFFINLCLSWYIHGLAR